MKPWAEPEYVPSLYLYVGSAGFAAAGAAEDDAVEPEEAVFVDVLLLDDVFVSVFAATFVSV